MLSCYSITQGQTRISVSITIKSVQYHFIFNADNITGIRMTRYFVVANNLVLLVSALRAGAHFNNRSVKDVH